MSLFERNQSLLLSSLPAGLIELNNDACGSYTVVPSRNGAPTLLHSGRRLLSGIDPAREADRAVERRINTSMVYVIFGWALGYVQQAVRRHCPAARILVFEPERELASLVLSRIDLSHAGPFYLFCDEEEMLHCLEQQDLARGRGYRDIAISSMVNRFPERFAQLEKRLLTVFSRKASSHLTRRVLGRRWFFNTLANIRFADRCVDPGALQQIWHWDSVVLIGAGPSLSRQLDVLISMRGKVPLIAVDSAVHVLARAGLVPDMILVMDSQYFNVWHLKFAELAHSLLVLDLSAVKTVGRLISSAQNIMFTRVVTVDEQGEHDVVPFSGYVCRRFGIPAMRLQSGGSVSTSAFDLCRQLGVKTLYTAGMDLAYEDLLSHSRGSAYERFHLHQAVRWGGLEDRLFRFLQSRRVEPLPGRERSTRDFSLKMYADWFVEAAAKSGMIMCDLGREEAAQTLRTAEGAGFPGLKRTGISVRRCYQALGDAVSRAKWNDDTDEFARILGDILPETKADRDILRMRISQRCDRYSEAKYRP